MKENIFEFVDYNPNTTLEEMYKLDQNIRNETKPTEEKKLKIFIKDEKK